METTINDAWHDAGLPDEWRPRRENDTPCHLPVIGISKNGMFYPNGEPMTPIIEWVNRDNEVAHAQGIGLHGNTINRLWQDSLKNTERASRMAARRKTAKNQKLEIAARRRITLDD